MTDPRLDQVPYDLIFTDIQSVVPQNMNEELRQ